MSINNEISNKWIKNIIKLDKKNRLAHGEIYSRDGSILEFNIDQNKVNAKVQGAPGDIYDVEITFQPFSDTHKQILIDYIKNNPLVYSKLLNNQIPEDLLYTKVKILPTSLKDFKMSCTCERGLFCKHKAAVFHKISHEIVKNPFLIFTLQGLDLTEIMYTESFKIKSIRDVLKKDFKIKYNNSKDINYLVKLNLLLSDFPSFYPSSSVNFNEVLCDTLASMSRSIYKIHTLKRKNEFQEFIILGNTLRSFEYFTSKSPEEIKHAFEEKWNHPQNWNHIKIDLNGNYEIIKINTGEFDNNFFMANLKYPLFAFLAEINQISMEYYCYEIRFLHELYMFTSQLINLNAIVPELFCLDNNEYHIRWIPNFEKSIQERLQYFIENCPDSLVTFYETNLSKQNQILTLISLLLEGFFRYYVNKHIPHKLSSYKNDTYFRLFFLKSQDLSSYSYKGKEIEIHNWISPLYLNQKDYEFVINTDQSDYEFKLKLKIRIDNELYDFKDIVDLKRGDIIKNISIIHNIFSKSGISFNLLDDEAMNLRQYSFFLDNAAPVLKECGIEVNTPKEFKNVENAKLVLNINTKTATTSLTIDDLTDFDWKIAIGDETFSIDEFESFSHNFRGLVKVKDKYFVLEEENLYQLREDIANIPDNHDKSELIKYLLSSDSANVEIDNKLEELVDNILEIKELKVPESLNGTLREYQKTGFSWMMQNMQVGFGSILADDMGLGKTIQILTLILHLKQNNQINDSKVLIVAPTSILTNWEMEIRKFAPTLNVKTYHGMNRHYPEDDFDILLTSYGMVRQDLAEFSQNSWKLLVIDEAQNIKNPNSKQTKAIKSIKAQHHIALSGTPIENHLGEYWSIFDFTNHGYLSNLKEFKKRFINPIQKEHDEFVLDDFKKITSPFILRRLKTDKNIIKELPDKIVNDIYCNLTVKQASMYDETLNQLIDDVESSEGIQRKGLVLKLINSLKQICNHPSHYLKTQEAKVNESGKMEVLMNLLENIIESGEKVLIFTQYVYMGEIMKNLIEKRFNEEVLFLHGGISRKKRDDMINKFQNEDSKIFILSLKAGGVGLNLTAASNVIHYDLWWNPAVENQATDRAYRIGQSENVMVYRFITTGTLEEKINQILLEKRELVDLAIGSEESFITEMSNEELRNMLNLRKGKMN